MRRAKTIGALCLGVALTACASTPEGAEPASEDASGSEAAAPLRTESTTIYTSTDPIDRDAQPAYRTLPTGFGHCLGDDAAPAAVTVMFDVTETGETTNIRIVETTDPCFDPYVLQAVDQWRYTPKLVGGEPRLRRGLRSIVRIDPDAEGRSAP